MVTNLPPHLRGERPLAEYFENMDLAVESVTLCREVGSLQELLDLRTKALLQLENAWTGYVGNPSTVEEYDPEGTGLVDTDIEGGHSTQTKLVVPHRARPTIRPGWLKGKVDALEYLEQRFKEADEQVKKKRRTGKFRSTGAAFVTFEKMSSAVRLFSFYMHIYFFSPDFDSKLLFNLRMPLTQVRFSPFLLPNREILYGPT